MLKLQLRAFPALAALAAAALPATAAKAGPMDGGRILTGGVVGAARTDTARPAWTSERMKQAVVRDARTNTQRRKRRPRRRRRHDPTRWLASDPTPALVAADLPGTRVIGRLFSRAPNGMDMACSATLVDSANRSLVWTAGHCVHSGRGGAPHTDLVFVPGYRPAATGGPAPFGVWPAMAWATTPSFAREGDNRHYRRDFGAVVLARDALGRTLTDVLGAAQHIAFSAKPPRRVAPFGYPGLSPFNGASLYSCGPNWTGRASLTFGAGPAPIAIACGQTAGASGGPWLGRRNATTGIGTVFSVTSVRAYVRPWLFAPVQNGTARRLYQFLTAWPN